MIIYGSKTGENNFIYIYYAFERDWTTCSTFVNKLRVIVINIIGTTYKESM